MKPREPLSPQKRRALKREAHHLKPVLWIGKNGLTDQVLAEINNAFAGRELIKIKIAHGESKADRKQISITIAERLNCDWVQGIGLIGVFFRPLPTKK